MTSYCGPSVSNWVSRWSIAFLSTIHKRISLSESAYLGVKVSLFTKLEVTNTSVSFPYLFTVKPHLITTPRNQSKVENKQVTFHCNATGHPIPKITWTKDGRTVGTGSKLTLTVSRGDAGRYWCTADNGVSADVRASAYLRVLCK